MLGGVKCWWNKTEWGYVATVGVTVLHMVAMCLMEVIFRHKFEEGAWMTHPPMFWRKVFQVQERVAQILWIRSILVCSNFFFPLVNRLPRWLSGKELVGQTGDADSIPGSERSPREGNGKPLQYACLPNSTDRGDWWATVHGVTKSLMT